MSTCDFRVRRSAGETRWNCSSPEDGRSFGMVRLRITAASGLVASGYDVGFSGGSHLFKASAKACGRYGLGKVVIHARLQAILSIASHGMCRHGDDGDLMIENG